MEQAFIPYSPDRTIPRLNAAVTGLPRESYFVAIPERQVWKSRLDGSQRFQLTFPPLQGLMPPWSPDGKQITFFGSEPGKPWEIFLISAEGGRPRQLMLGEGSKQDTNFRKDLGVHYFNVADKRTVTTQGLNWLKPNNPMPTNHKTGHGTMAALFV